MELILAGRQSALALARTWLALSHLLWFILKCPQDGQKLTTPNMERIGRIQKISPVLTDNDISRPKLWKMFPVTLYLSSDFFALMHFLMWIYQFVTVAMAPLFHRDAICIPWIWDLTIECVHGFVTNEQNLENGSTNDHAKLSILTLMWLWGHCLIGYMMPRPWPFSAVGHCWPHHSKVINENLHKIKWTTWLQRH